VFFEVLARKALNFVDLKLCKLNFDFLVYKLRVPLKYLYSARAILYESRFFFEKAIFEWKNAANFDKTHSIFVKRIAPLYFNMTFKES